MNIFATSDCPKISACVLPDKLVVKMILESAQLLCTTIIHYRPMTVTNKSWKLTYRWAHLSTFISFWCRCQPIYSPAHKAHPCTLWTMKGDGNFFWLYEHALAMGEEYTRRYGKVHKSIAIIEQVGEWIHWVDELPRTRFIQAMPDELKDPADPTKAYRRYLITKSYFPGYKKGRDFSSYMLGEVEEVVL